MKKPRHLLWCPICRSFYRAASAEQKCPQWGQHAPPADWFWDDEELPSDLDQLALAAIEEQVKEWNNFEKAKQDLQIPFRIVTPWDVLDN